MSYPRLAHHKFLGLRMSACVLPKARSPSYPFGPVSLSMGAYGTVRFLMNDVVILIEL